MNIKQSFESTILVGFLVKISCGIGAQTVTPGPFFHRLPSMYLPYVSFFYRYICPLITGAFNAILYSRFKISQHEA